MVPRYQELMLPLLGEVKDGAKRSLKDIELSLAEQFSLSEEDFEQLLPSGHQRVFNNRLAWAATYLSKAGLLLRPERGYIQITERGTKVLEQEPKEINIKYLNRFDEFNLFHSGIEIHQSTGDDSTPLEDLEKGFGAVESSTRDEILQKLHEVTPSHFEHIVIDVLVAMGYGGSFEDAAQAVGKSGDGGIDGLINEDRLGLDSIYVQAKRWQNNVGRPDIQSFVGALSGKHATKGVFITTASFSHEAREYASGLREKVILIDGDRLTSLMYEFDVGVSTENVYKVKRLDTDYFLG